MGITSVGAIFIPGGKAMTVLDVLILLIIAAIAGALGQAIAGYSAGGCLTSIVVGFIGALIGLLLARALRLPDLIVITIAGKSFPLIWSIIGAALFVAVIRLITAPARRRYYDE